MQLAGVPMGPLGKARSPGIRGERDGLSGPIATAARGRVAPGKGPGGSTGPRQSEGCVMGNRHPSPPQPAGKQPQPGWHNRTQPRGGEGRTITRGQGCGAAAFASALAPGDTLRPRCGVEGSRCGRRVGEPALGGERSMITLCGTCMVSEFRLRPARPIAVPLAVLSTAFPCLT